jgi:hypothetical protein
MSKRNAGREENCNFCFEYESCERNICDSCGTCEGKIFHIEEENFSLCPECLMMVQREIIKGIPATDQGIKLEEVFEEDERVIVTRKRITEEEREFIFNRDGRKCVFCKNKDGLQIDHIIPFSKGGTTEFNNLQTLCFLCNSKKGARL